MTVDDAETGEVKDRDRMQKTKRYFVGPAQVVSEREAQRDDPKESEGEGGRAMRRES